MTAIPLHCNICPKEPDFSDISHLLTHVASKGHLSHYHKAQIRGRQDQTIRQKIDDYDQWYQKYQIEKLLSQRMTTKESKDITKRVKPAPKAKASSLKPLQPIKSRKRNVKVPKSDHPVSSPVKAEVAIDPQLDHALLPPFEPQQYLQESIQASGAANRAHVPRMIDWQFESPCRPLRSSSLPLPVRTSSRSLIHSDQSKADGESDYFRTFLRSPSRTVYPDPSEYDDVAARRSCEQGTVTKSNCSRESAIIDSSIPDSHLVSDKEDYTISPILKGVKWPGMSLFDSASLEAQRLRNQKKDGSMLESMQHDSAMIEPMEHIFWPEGRLKKTRLITGNVESSPINEPTPPPKRRKSKTARAVLSELSTNAPRASLNRGNTRRKAPPSTASDLYETSQRALAAMRTFHSVNTKNNRTTHDLGEDEKYESKSKRLFEGGRRKAFDVFTESAPQAPETPTKYKSKAVEHDKMLDSFMAHKNSDTSEQTRQSLQRALMTEDRRKLDSILERNESIDDEAFELGEERVTQRYFSVTGNQPPQFFNNMPSQMDFGGLAGPLASGATLNPLNAYVHRHRLQQNYTPIYLSRVSRNPGTYQLHNIDTHNSQKALVSDSARVSHRSEPRTGI